MILYLMRMDITSIMTGVLLRNSSLYASIPVSRHLALSAGYSPGNAEGIRIIALFSVDFIMNILKNGKNYEYET